MELPKLTINISVDDAIRCKCVLNAVETVGKTPFDISNTIKDYSTIRCPSIDSNELKNQSGGLSLKCASIPTNILLIKPFIHELNESQKYRLFTYKYFNSKLKNYLKNDINKGLRIILKAYSADSYVIDYAWGWRLWRECHLGLERDLASAWLSTLGGAFSALGDNSTKCAEMALRISFQQIRLSATGGDEDGVARGCLFLALALSQLDHGRSSRVLLHNAFSRRSSDPRHRSMCLGVQAKLKYDSKLRRLARKKRREAKLLLKGKGSVKNQGNADEKLNVDTNEGSTIDTCKSDVIVGNNGLDVKDYTNEENKKALWDLLMSLKL